MDTSPRYTLTKRQISCANRPGGMELMLSWPRDKLPSPDDLEEDEERDATPLEWDVVRLLLGLPRLGLPLIKGVKVWKVRRPKAAGGGVEPHLAVHLISHLAFRTPTDRLPRLMWARENEEKEK